MTVPELDKLIGISEDQLLEDVGKYMKLIATLLYMTMSRPDIPFSVQTLSQFMQQPKKSHWNEVRLCYLIKYGESPVSWKFKNQSTISKSSAEAEYMSMASVISEIVWITTLL
ncbi:secreted RxLR effector protein 161-like [Nicotiana tabacum]|uniref:Secreted RxLR effector protein 161-like n=1 Tax=Nicotiana tabacum TaxID=4097 RepID=A0AC58S4P5_TOBAC